MMEVYEDYPGTILGVQEVPRSRVSSYGIVKPELIKKNLWRATDLAEKLAAEDAPSCLAVLGRYIIEPRIFDILSTTPPGNGGEIQLTDALRILAANRPIYVYCFDGRHYDVGDKEGYLEAAANLYLRGRTSGSLPFTTWLKH
jgi:UTP--glucose-1-phosphate uridylyltransferase